MILKKQGMDEISFTCRLINGCGTMPSLINQPVKKI
jgi:hypothetical protein